MLYRKRSRFHASCKTFDHKLSRVRRLRIRHSIIRSAFLHPARGLGQQHPVMRHTYDLNNSVGANTVYHEMSGLSDPLVWFNQGAAQPKMVCPNSRDARNRT